MQIRSLINPELHLWFCRTGSVSVFRTVVGSEDHELVCSTRLKITFGLWIFMERLRRKCRCDVSPPAVTCVFLTFETSGGADGCQSGWRTNSRSSCVNVRRGLPRLICSGLSRADRRRTRHSWHGSSWRASALEVILCFIPATDKPSVTSHSCEEHSCYEIKRLKNGSVCQQEP